jgi:catechol 2,3-dioxygenase-like lactoylglutathione lyase family enzyme
MSKPLVKEISHIQIPVLDLNRSFEFYLEILGFRLKGNFGEFAVIGLDKGVTIFLWVTQDQTTTTFTVNGENFPSFGIEIESMDELTNNLKQYGSEIIWANEDQEGRKFSKFYDPDGNMIVAHEEPKNIL